MNDLGDELLSGLPDEVRAVSGSGDKTVRVWDLAERTLLDVITLPGKIYAARVADDGTIVVGFDRHVAAIEIKP